MVAGFASEWWPTSNRNGGRLRVGIPGRNKSESADYARTGNSYAQPHNRWVLSNLVVNDGQPGDGQDTEVTSYAWSGGLYERRERQFYGFAQCVESHLDPANANVPYRTVTRVYNNTSYYLKGTLAQESLAGAQGRKFTEAAHFVRWPWR